MFHQASGDEPNQFKPELLRNEVQLYLVSLRSPLDYGHGEGLSRAPAGRSSRPLTALPMPIIEPGTKRNEVQLSFVPW